MDPTTYDDLLRAAIDAFLKLWNALPPHIQAKVLAEWKALMEALRLARAAGTGSAELKAVLEALKRFIAALTNAGAEVPTTVRTWVTLIENQIAAMGAEAGGAGAFLTVSAILLILLALILTAMSIYEIYKMYGPADAPVGGPPCGNTNPIARNLEAESYSYFGQRRAFKNAEEEARTAAQGFTCQGSCATTKCRGNCAITEIKYKYRLFWTVCELKYDVWCECY